MTPTPAAAAVASRSSSGSCRKALKMTCSVETPPSCRQSCRQIMPSSTDSTLAPKAAIRPSSLCFRSHPRTSPASEHLRRHAVQLREVQPLHAQPPERRLGRRPQRRLGVPVGEDPAGPAELRGDDAAVTPRNEPPHRLLARPAAVHVRRVEEADTRVVRRAENLRRRVGVPAAGPAAADLPAAQPHLGHGRPAPVQRAMSHAGTVEALLKQEQSLRSSAEGTEARRQWGSRLGRVKHARGGPRRTGRAVFQHPAPP